MKALFITASLLAFAVVSPVASAQTTSTSASSPAAPATASYSTEETPLGDLLDNPETKAVLLKHIPQVINNEQIDQARGMTLKAIQQYAADVLTDEVLEAIDEDLAKVPAPK